jgi:hypothetical protein
MQPTSSEQWDIKFKIGKTNCFLFLLRRCTHAVGGIYCSADFGELANSQTAPHMTPVFSRAAFF